MRRDCLCDGKHLNISERILVDLSTCGFFATFLYTAGVEPIAGIGRMLLIESAPQTGQI
jgi:hypothetical protein